jgi:hypothetical protein
MVSDRGDRCLFNFQCGCRLFLNIFPFPVCKVKLIGDWFENCSVRLFYFDFFVLSANRKASFYPPHFRFNEGTDIIGAPPCLLRILPTLLYIFCVLCAIIRHRCANILAHRSPPPPKGNADQTRCANNIKPCFVDFFS